MGKVHEYPFPPKTTLHSRYQDQDIGATSKFKFKCEYQHCTGSCVRYSSRGPSLKDNLYCRVPGRWGLQHTHHQGWKLFMTDGLTRVIQKLLIQTSFRLGPKNKQGTKICKKAKYQKSAHQLDLEWQGWPPAWNMSWKSNKPKHQYLTCNQNIMHELRMLDRWLSKYSVFQRTLWRYWWQLKNRPGCILWHTEQVGPPDFSDCCPSGRPCKSEQGQKVRSKISKWVGKKNIGPWSWPDVPKNNIPCYVKQFKQRKQDMILWTILMQRVSKVQSVVKLLTYKSWYCSTDSRLFNSYHWGHQKYFITAQDSWIPWIIVWFVFKGFKGS